MKIDFGPLLPPDGPGSGFILDTVITPFVGYNPPVELSPGLNAQGGSPRDLAFPG